MGIRVGTCGWSYDEWRNVFYPPKLSKGKFLEYYSSQFNAVELNATFYRLPSLKALEGMVKRTPPGFSFVVKAHQALTHARGGAESMLPLFREALRPFAEGGKLGAVLLQFPHSFRPSPEAVAHVEAMAEGLGGAPAVVEFRHRDWFTPKGLGWLRHRSISLCCVDEPPLPGLPPPAAEVTGPVAYVRFHGRNAGAWWGKGPAPKPGDPIGHDRADGREAGERYRYLYKEEELKDWVPRVREMAGKAGVLYAFFNNHPEGFAVRNAKEFRNLVGARGENAQD